MNQLARRALEIDAEQPTALSVLIQVSERLGEFDSLAENITQAARKHPDSRRALAVMLSERGDFDTAAELYRLNLESTEAAAQDAMLLAQVITAATRQALLREDVLPWRIPDTYRQALEDAEALATRAIDAWRLDDSRNRYHEALVIRSVLRGMLGKPQTALDDCHAVLQENPTHYHALVNAGVAALQLSQWKEATTMLEQAMAIQILPDSQIPLAAVYLHEKRYRDVLRVLGEVKISEQPEDLQRLELAAQAYHNLGQEDHVERIASS